MNPRAPLRTLDGSIRAICDRSFNYRARTPTCPASCLGAGLTPGLCLPLLQELLDRFPHDIGPILCPAEDGCDALKSALWKAGNHMIKEFFARRHLRIVRDVCNGINNDSF